MAIENDQLEISQMINSLAKILRYSINNSNAIVPLRAEVDLLKKYIFLQRTRSKNNFECTIEVDESLLEYPIHKLLLQPFIENAIVHGFSDESAANQLDISIQKRDDDIVFTIQDNGLVMDANALNRARSQDMENGDHIGMSNAIGRIKMYYGGIAKVEVDSTFGKGTTVTVTIHKPEQEEWS